MRLRALLIHKGTKPLNDAIVQFYSLRALLIHKGTKPIPLTIKTSYMFESFVNS